MLGRPRKGAQGFWCSWHKRTPTHLLPPPDCPWHEGQPAGLPPFGNTAFTWKAGRRSVSQGSFKQRPQEQQRFSSRPFPVHARAPREPSASTLEVAAPFKQYPEGSSLAWLSHHPGKELGGFGTFSLNRPSLQVTQIILQHESSWQRSPPQAAATSIISFKLN